MRLRHTVIAGLLIAVSTGCAVAPLETRHQRVPLPAAEEAALTEFNSGDYAGAYEQYAALAAQSPPRAELWGAASLAAARAGRLDDAIAARARARALDPADPWHRLRAARLLLAASRFEDALREIEPPSSCWDQLTKAQALRRLGRPEDALGALVSATAADPLAPLPLQERGEILEALGRPAEAATAYSAALALDPSQGHLQLRLARNQALAGALDPAFERYRRALLVDPGDPAAVAGRATLLVAAPRLAARDTELRAGRERAWRDFTPPRTPPLPPVPLTAIAVGIVTELDGFRLKCASACLLDPGDGCLTAIPAGTDLSGTVLGDRLLLSWTDGSATLAAPVRLEAQEPDATFGIFNVHFERGSYWSDEETRWYRGALEVRPAGRTFTLVNHVSLEDYLLSVVPSEMPPEWPLEALKAQAVAARAETLTKLRRHQRDGYNVCATQHCAVYRGALNEREPSSRAVRETRGEILQGANGPLDAVYAGNCGGWGSAAAAVWGSGVKELGAVCDLPAAARRTWDAVPDNPDERERFLYARPPAWCARRPATAAFRWTRSYTWDELDGWLGRRLKIKGLRSVRVTSSTREGWVTGAAFAGDGAPVEAKRDAVRPALRTVRSNFFALERLPPAGDVPEQLLLVGGGWGHGVGMCQDGAGGLALAGRRYRWILAHYYPEAVLARLY